MSNKFSVFPATQQPQHFNDYGFEPQIDYFEVMEEARKQSKRGSWASSSWSTGRSMDLRYRLQKPTSKDESSKKIKKSGKKKRWWRNALMYFKFPKWAPAAADLGGRRHRIGSISGPVYVTESRAGTGGFAKGGVEIPYVSLGGGDRSLGVRATSATPIYLVT